jgi:putative CocE/NonD family hydrolase
MFNICWCWQYRVCFTSIRFLRESRGCLVSQYQSNYGSNGINRWILVDAPDAVMTRTEADSQTLVYETPPLSQGIEVTGHPLVHLWVSANQDDADVFVYLTDVDPDGNSHYVSEGQLRASFHRSADPIMQSGGNLEVRPELPWHGFRSVDQARAALADGKVVELNFDLMPTSWFFEQGHKIRISIAGADYGNFQPNPTICTTADIADCAETTLTIHRGTGTPSRIVLPVIPDTQTALISHLK